MKIHLALVVGLLLPILNPTQVQAQTEQRFFEDFESTALDSLPTGWTLEDNSENGGPAEWKNWAVKDFDAFRASGGGRNNLHSDLTGRGPVADSDLYGHFDFDSALLTPPIDVTGDDVLVLTFESGYRHNSNQRAELEYRWDNGNWITVFAWFDGDGLHQDEQHDNRAISVTVTNAGAAAVQFRWRMRENFGWYWGLDEVRLLSLGDTTQAPNQPSTVQPAPGAIGVPLNPVLMGSTFSDPDPFDTMGGSQWQIIPDGDDFSSPLHDSGLVPGPAITYQVPPTVLTLGQTYAWRVRYQDLAGSWSLWSDSATFTLQDEGGLLFANIQSSSGVTRVSSRGGAWLDYDNDGYQDLWTGSTIYRNQNGSGTFEFIRDLPSPTSGSKAGTACADYNNDGFIDIFVGSQWLYHNNDGDGSFTLLSSGFGFTGNFASQAVVWGDMNNDGWVDVYAVGDNGASGLLYENRGGTSFVNITDSAGVTDSREGYGGSWADADNDGDLDLFVANCGSSPGESRWDSYFENQGNGLFIERAQEVGIQGDYDSWASAWGDYDNDQDLDLYLVSTSGNDRFFRNDNGAFVDLSGQAGIPNGSNREAVWADFDNDGDLDLYICRTSGGNLLFRNDGNDTFVEIADQVNVDDPGVGRVASVADFDNDGDLDMFIGNSGNTPGLYQNLLGPSRWLILRLTGRYSNRAAVGARVYVTTGNTTQMREVSGGGGLYTQLMLPVHFGLGDATEADEVVLRWPSGMRQSLGRVAGNQILDVEEARPELSVDRDGNDVVITWPAVQGFVLQMKSDLDGASWGNVSEIPTEMDGRNEVRLSSMSGMAYFRLIRNP